MKTTKRVLGTLLALALVFGLAMPAMAADDDAPQAGLLGDAWKMFQEFFGSLPDWLQTVFAVPLVPLVILLAPVFIVFLIWAIFQYDGIFLFARDRENGY